MLVHLPLYPHTAIFNKTNPGTTNYLFSGAATATGLKPSEDTVLVRVCVNLGGTSTLIYGITDGTTTVTGTLNGGTALTGGQWYTFEVEARRTLGTVQTCTYDFILGSNVTVNALFVSEVGGGVS